MSNVFQQAKPLSHAQMRRKNDARDDAALFNAPIDLIKTDRLIELHKLVTTKQLRRMIKNELMRRGVILG